MYFDMDGDGYGGSDSIVTLACSFPAGYSLYRVIAMTWIPPFIRQQQKPVTGLMKIVMAWLMMKYPYQLLSGCWYMDLALPDSLILSCFIPDGYINNPWDCNDLDNTIHNLVTYWLDADGDGYGTNDSLICFVWIARRKDIHLSMATAMTATPMWLMLNCFMRITIWMVMVSLVLVLYLSWPRTRVLQKR